MGRAIEIPTHALSEKLREQLSQRVDNMPLFNAFLKDFESFVRSEDYTGALAVLNEIEEYADLALF